MNIPNHYQVSDNIVGDVQLLTRGRAGYSSLSVCVCVCVCVCVVLEITICT